MKVSPVFDLLESAGPSPDGAENLLLYGQLVGSWDVDSTWYTGSGATVEGSGEWHFSWILGGRGIQDVLFRSGAPSDQYGTTLRCYDKAIDAWRIAWMQPASGEFVHLVGRRRGERIVQEGLGVDPSRRERWSFFDITADSFSWEGEVSLDGGATWTLEQKMVAKRRR